MTGHFLCLVSSPTVMSFSTVQYYHFMVPFRVFDEINLHAVISNSFIVLFILDMSTCHAHFINIIRFI